MRAQPAAPSQKASWDPEGPCHCQATLQNCHPPGCPIPQPTAPTVPELSLLPPRETLASSLHGSDADLPEATSCTAPKPPSQGHCSLPQAQTVAEKPGARLHHAWEQLVAPSRSRLVQCPPALSEVNAGGLAPPPQGPATCHPAPHSTGGLGAGGSTVLPHLPSSPTRWGPVAHRGAQA